MNPGRWRNVNPKRINPGWSISEVTPRKGWLISSYWHYHLRGINSAWCAIPIHKRKGCNMISQRHYNLIIITLYHYNYRKKGFILIIIPLLYPYVSCMEYLPTFTQHKSSSFVGKYSSTRVPWFADGLGYQHPHYIYITGASQYWNIYIYLELRKIDRFWLWCGNFHDQEDPGIYIYIYIYIFFSGIIWYLNTPISRNHRFWGTSPLRLAARIATSCAGRLAASGISLKKTWNKRTV